MTQTIEHQLEKQDQIDYWYEAALRALGTNDYTQAKSLALKGLNEAIDIQDARWVDTLREFIEDLPESQHIKQEEKITNEEKEKILVQKSDLTQVSGIGPKLQTNLEEHGIHTISDLVQKTPEELSEIPGIGVKTAEKMLSTGRNCLPAAQKTGKPQKKEKSKEKKNSKPIAQQKTQIIEKVSETSGDPNEIMVEEAEPKPEKVPSKPNIKVRTSGARPPEAELNLNKTPQSTREMLTRYMEVREFQEPTKETPKPIKASNKKLKGTAAKLKPLKQKIGNMISKVGTALSTMKSEIKTKFESETKNERISHDPKKKHIRPSTIVREISEIAKGMGYQLITPDQYHFPNLDQAGLLLLKEYRDDEKSNLLVIHPVIFLTSKEPLFLSSDQVVSKREEQTSPPIPLEESLRPLRENIKEDLRNAGELFSRVKTTYYPDLMVKKTISKKGLFLISEGKQVEITVEPIILSKNKVKSLDKVSLFPFSRTHRAYVIQDEDLNSLLLYLEEKYRAIDLLDDSKPTLETYISFSREFTKYLRLISVPFLVFGIAVSAMLFLPLKELDGIIFDILLYPTLALSCMLFSYCFIQYQISIRNIKQSFLRSMYSIPITIDRSGFYLLTEHLQKGYLEQFLFEFSDKISEKDFEEIERETVMPNAVHPKGRAKVSPKMSTEEQNSDDTFYFTKEEDLEKRFSSFMED